MYEFICFREAINAVHAYSEGAIGMISVSAGMLAMLIATLATVEFINTTLIWFGDRVGSSEGITLQVSMYKP